MSARSVLLSNIDNRRRRRFNLLGYRRYRLRMSGLMLFADLAGFTLAGGFLYTLNLYLDLFVFNWDDLKYLLPILLSLILFTTSKLYPGVGINPAEEIKLITQFISMGFLIGLIVLGFAGYRIRLNVLALLPGWGLSLMAILLMRWIVRIASARLGWWGEPVVVLDGEGAVNGLPCYFCSKRRLGFLPVMVTNDRGRKCQDCPVPVIEPEGLLASETNRFAGMGIQTVLIDSASAFGSLRPAASRDLLRLFRHLIFVSDMDWLEGASVRIHDYEGLMGIEAQKNTLNPVESGIKRGMDILVAILIGLVAVPLMMIVAMFIKMDSPGPVFYKQERAGKQGRPFRIYKFRTMVRDADRLLAEYLERHPEARREWEQDQKLRFDPRITRIGRLLRRYSIDELPQLFNVVRGEMSLAGPRPMMMEQTSLYGEHIDAYYGVRPGITGFWQVSGRNSKTFQERIHYDQYYIRNWSIWLDLYILFRTVWVVLSRDGAY